jgi:hypothetical protein
VLIPFATPARAAQVLPLHTRGGLALLLLARLIQRADHQAAAPPGTPGCLIESGHGELAHHAHRCERVPGRPVE